MIIRTKLILFTLAVPFLSPAQRQKKNDQLLLDNLLAHIRYLTDDKLEGRRTGSAGEKLASDYISIEFSNAGLQPKGDQHGWLQAFEIDEGRQINADSYFSVNDQPLVLNKEYFPLAFSAAAAVSGSPAIALQEGGVPWFIDLKELLETDQGSTHAEFLEALRSRIKEYAKKGATAVILYNTSKLKDNLAFDPRDRSEALDIPVLYLQREARKKYLKDESASLDIKLRTGFTEKTRTGHNVLGYLDNGAPYTVIIGAHYDHLGYGEDGNSLYQGPRAIHRGADDNASGVAAIIELSRLLAASRLKNNNYLFIAFSGGELGLYGSRYFVEHPAIDLKQVNYMINLDRIGRLNDSSHALTIGGYGTSPVWGQVCNSVPDKKNFALRYDSSGGSPSGSHGSFSGDDHTAALIDPTRFSNDPTAFSSDHTPFYDMDIPVIFFYTGWNSDYHQPTDDFYKINYPGELAVLKYVYDIVQSANSKGKLAFLKTAETPSPASK